MGWLEKTTNLLAFETDFVELLGVDSMVTMKKLNEYERNSLLWCLLTIAYAISKPLNIIIPEDTYGYNIYNTRSCYIIW